MEDYGRLWDDCLAMIREKYGEKWQHWFDVWYGGVRFESYDPDTRTLLVRVPSKYVYEYLEMNGANDIRWATQEAFKTSVVLQYRIAAAEPAFGDIAAWLQQHSAYDSRRDPCHIAVPNARKRLEDGLRYFVGDAAKWLPAYDQVASWLTDNKGRGLLCVGTSGLGKTLLCQQILPVILGNGGRPIASVNARDLHGRLDELKNERIVIIDDLGKEPRKHYGETDQSFFELCNHAERTGQLLVITTNLSTTPVSEQFRDRYPLSIQERYGTEVLDRLRTIVKSIQFAGTSMRK